jgi:monoamine oxidase
MGDRGTQSPIVVGYSALIDFLVKDCRTHGGVLHQGAKVAALESENGGVAVRCTDGSSHLCDAAILTLSLPLLNDITFPPAERERVAAVAHVSFGNVMKILFRFRSRWWLEQRKDLADLVFLLSNEKIPV